jgi:C1A family cysteine protease
MLQRTYGFRPSPIDPRNLVTKVSVGASPAECDPRGQASAPSVVDQLQIGSCTANAFRTALLRALLVSGQKPYEEPSRLHIYGGERTLAGDFSTDAGAEGHDAFRFARKFGVAYESAWPYGDGSTLNSAADYRHAQGYEAKFRIKQYSHPHPDTETFKTVLWAGKYICFGFTVYEGFESEAVAKSGIVPLPKRGEQVLGGHEVCAVGYVLVNGEFYFVCQNSWGTDWGQDGFFLFPESYMFGYGTSDWRCIDTV